MLDHENRVRDEFTAGMGLSVDGEKIRFFHRWNLIAARKPGDR